jgi:hypothetical protein
MGLSDRVSHLRDQLTSSFFELSDGLLGPLSKVDHDWSYTLDLHGDIRVNGLAIFVDNVRFVSLHINLAPVPQHMCWGTAKILVLMSVLLRSPNKRNVSESAGKSSDLPANPAAIHRFGRIV